MFTSLQSVKAMVTVGGYTGSRYFSGFTGTEESRSAFVKACMNFASKYKLDGLDFDWEFITGKKKFRWPMVRLLFLPLPSPLDPPRSSHNARSFTLQIGTFCYSR